MSCTHLVLNDDTPRILTLIPGLDPAHCYRNAEEILPGLFLASVARGTSGKQRRWRDHLLRKHNDYLTIAGYCNLGGPDNTTYPVFHFTDNSGRTIDGYAKSMAHGRELLLYLAKEYY